MILDKLTKKYMKKNINSLTCKGCDISTVVGEKYLKDYIDDSEYVFCLKCAKNRVGYELIYEKIELEAHEDNILELENLNMQILDLIGKKSRGFSKDVLKNIILYIRNVDFKNLESYTKNVHIDKELANMEFELMKKEKNENIV